MTRITWTATASLLLIVCSSSTAQAQWFQDDNPWVPYVAGTVQGAFMDIEAGGFNSQAGGFYAFDSDRDDTLGLGGALGISKEFGSFRVRSEIEGMWYEDQQGMVHGSFPGPPGPAAFFYRSNLDENWSVMGNLWIDLYCNDYLAWYLGGGTGVSSANLSTNDTQVSGRASDEAFAWQVGTGLLMNISDNCELDLGYRYVDLGTIETDLYVNPGIGGAGNPAGSLELDRESHNIALTLRLYLYE